MLGRIVETLIVEENGTEDSALGWPGLRQSAHSLL
jgi:hypothetical protein